MKISDIKGTEKLSNYNELKNIEVEREIDYDNYDRKGDYAYVKGENKPVNGLIVARKNNKIIALIPYVNGNGNGKKYEYYENGKLRMEITLRNNIKNGNAFSYTNDGKLLCKIQYKDDIEMLSECYYQDSSLEQVYKSINGKLGILTTYYKGTNKKSYISEVNAETGEVTINLEAPPGLYSEVLKDYSEKTVLKKYLKWLQNNYK